MTDHIPKLPKIAFEESVRSSMDDNSTVVSGSHLTDASTINTQQPTRCNVSL
jgi:hypothetical protein